jgi:hypothetical protein
MQNKFAIGIPTLNRFDLLYPSLLMYLKDFPKTHIFVVDNGKQGIDKKLYNDRLTIVNNDWNIGVATSWNLLCDRIFEVSNNALILNDDIYLGKKENEIEDILRKKSDLYLSKQSWSVFILPQKTYNEIGRFDDKFYPAYYEDADYTYRMKLAKKNINSTPLLNPFLYKESQTLVKAPEIISGSIANKKLYIEKWGGEPKQEKFIKPYNEAKN